MSIYGRMMEFQVGRNMYVIDIRPWAEGENSFSCVASLDMHLPVALGTSSLGRPQVRRFRSTAGRESNVEFDAERLSGFPELGASVPRLRDDVLSRTHTGKHRSRKKNGWAS